MVPRLNLGIVTPLINASPQRFRSFADTAPIFGWWNAHVGPGTIPAIAIGLAAVLWGPTLARRLPWRTLPWVSTRGWRKYCCPSSGPSGWPRCGLGAREETKRG